MKSIIPLFITLILCSCSQSEPPKEIVEKKPDLNFPNAVLSCKHHEWGVTMDLPIETNLNLVGSSYVIRQGIRGITVNCDLLSSTQLAIDSPLDENGKSYQLGNADIYLVQVKIPNRNWITKTVIDQGADQTVIDENEITIWIKHDS